VLERFTDLARRVVILAQEEARRLNHNHVGTEHILLGLISEGQGVAARALESLGIGLEPARQEVEEIIGRGEKAPSGNLPFTPRVKKVLALSLREAIQFGHNYISTEHILLGLVQEGEGVAVQVLARLGAEPNRVRQQVTRLIRGGGQEGGGEEAGAGPARATSKGPPQVRLATRDIGQIEVLHQLSRIADRLEAIERHLGMRSGGAEPGGGAADQPGPHPPDPGPEPAGE
jgi:ATP-dependent Clp protease ATP-binding subunit ClpC